MSWQTELLRVAVFAGVGGFIGWVTNVLAIKALFHPREPVRAGGISFQGLLPKRQPELARNLGSIIEGELFSLDEVLKDFQPEDFDPLIREAVHKYRQDLEEAVRPKLEPFGAQFLLNPLLGGFEERAFNILRRQVPEIAEKAIRHLHRKVSVKDLVQAKIEAMDIMRLEDLINRIADREMKLIMRLGGVLGVVMGIAQYAVMQVIGGFLG